LNQIKHTAESFATIYDLEISNLNNFLSGSASNPQPILNALTSHPGVDVRTLLDINSVSKFKDKLSRIPKVVTMSGDESRKTARVFRRGPSKESKTPFYRYFDTATTPTSPFRPELIEQLMLTDGSSDIHRSYFNHGHFEDQLTLYLGDINLHWLDNSSGQRVFTANQFATSYKLPFIPHTFTSRTEHCGRILAVTYLGPIANQEFVSISKDLTLDKLCELLDAYEPDNNPGAECNSGVVTSDAPKISQFFLSGSPKVNLIDQVPGQPNSSVSLLCLSPKSKLVLPPNLNHQWLFNCSTASVETSWEDGVFDLAPDSSMAVSPMTELRVQNPNNEFSTIPCFSVRAGEGDPFLHAKRILKFVGRDAISRLQHETCQWFD
jgi:hypothetical protein